MNAVVVAVLVMLILSLLRMNVVLSLVIGAVIGGLTGGLTIHETLKVFTDGLGGNSSVALSYGLLGAFAVAISKTGLPDVLVNYALKLVDKKGENRTKALSKVLIIGIVLVMACFSQNVIPIHIAFIPILIPPLLKILNELQVDRRLVAMVITFGLTTPYFSIPAGFGAIFQNEVLRKNIKLSGLDVSTLSIPKAMALPVAGMILGLLLAIWVYRKPRTYHQLKGEEGFNQSKTYTTRSLLTAIAAIVLALVVQITLDGNMIIGAVTGILVIFLGGAIKWRDYDVLLTEGMRMMAFIGFVMLAASGFAAVLHETGAVTDLVKTSAALIGDNKGLAAALMLLVGLLVTLGIGSSFSTVPIIATIYVPLAMELGFSPMAILSLVGTAAVLGDAGSPASDSTLGPTSGLNVDGQHNHIWDTCVPTFVFYNIPLLVFGWVAAMIL